MPPLPTNLRKDLEKAVIQARDAAEAAATAALQVLAVDVDRAFDSMSEEQKAHRTALRARMRALAPTDTAHGGLADPRPRGFGPLVEEVAYEQWHRMLFARFLAENDLLIHPEHGVSVSLEECSELAASEGEPDEWMVAARYASAMLPGIFRRDDPSAQVRFAPDGRAALERILKALPVELFKADDALGWVYQFWQTKAKDEVNNSGRKVGGKDLAPVTQLFTEHYMVRFLLENSLGAWWAGRHPDSPLLKEWEYLRFRDDGTPAAGTFDGWPATAAEVTVMDPCCGSGHFLVAAADMLRKMRMEEEGLTQAEASVAVLRDNLFGLELDARCTQIAVFALALDAWKVGGFGRPPLPNIACSGVAVGGNVKEWIDLAGDDGRLRYTLERLWDLFKDAADLGSLINPTQMPVQERMFSAEYEKVAPMLRAALAKYGNDPASTVFGAVAEGAARAGELLAGCYTLVATNPPYRGGGDLADTIKTFLRARYPLGQSNLATAFLTRCREMVDDGGSYAMVILHEWLFLGSYRELRRRWLDEQSFCHITRLGPRAFETIGGERVNVALIVVSNEPPQTERTISGLDVSSDRTPALKAEQLRRQPLLIATQDSQYRNPELRLALAASGTGAPLALVAQGLVGIQTGDNPHYMLRFWEVAISPKGPWTLGTSSSSKDDGDAGREWAFRWHQGTGELHRDPQARIQGTAAFGKPGVLVNRTGGIRCSRYFGELYDQNVAVISPLSPDVDTAVFAFCTSDEYVAAVRRIDQKLNVTNATLVKVPFDRVRWQQVADERYADGLPEPHSDDPTQWLFRGNALGLEAPLQVTVGRLLGYRWPDQEPDALDQLADEDGIVCLPALQGEREGSERLRAFLAAAHGEAWTAGTVDSLLADVGYAGKSLEQWLRDGFFEQHCKLFHHRPFIWQIWDGRRDGFSALVNYHKLDGPKLQKLAYTYLGAWLERQRDEKARNVAGADDRLAAAQALQRKLSLILEGEKPFDIYVRWKKPHEQAIGWNPDLDDGVRMNIRPFVEAGVLRWKPNIKWGIDRGKNPDGSARNNDVHLTIAEKQEARRRAGVGP